MSNFPLISIVIVAHRAGTNFRRCVESCVEQSYKRIELIIVGNKLSYDQEITTTEYASNYDNVRYIKGSDKKGVLSSIISGVSECSGQYLAFADSEGYISADWIRMLYNRIESSNSDMTIGDLCVVNGDEAEYYNLDPLRCTDIEVTGSECIDLFMEQKGLFFGFYSLYNKLIKKTIWDMIIDKLNSFVSENKGYDLSGDRLISALLWLNSKKVTNVHGPCGFVGKTYDILVDIKNYVRDMSATMRCIEKEVTIVSDKYSEELRAWKSLEGRIAFEKCDRSDLPYNDYNEIIKAFGMEAGGGRDFDDIFFYHRSTELGKSFYWHEDIIKFIISPACEYVCFDIFDTLILRPFFQPSDIFFLMNDLFAQIIHTDSYINFSNIRTEAERICRKKLEAVNSKCEEITLEQIYEQIGKCFGICEKDINRLIEKEISLELRFCVERKAGRELYELAKHCGKKIILISDMYLPRGAVEKILSKNGYTDHELFLSSEILLGKWTGNLFRYVVEKIGIKDRPDMKSIICHIGDNWFSDHDVPQRYGFSVFHMSSPVELFKNNNPGIYCGESYKMIFENGGLYCDMPNAVSCFIGLRTSLAMAANRVFDRPTVEFDRNTDFNSDPYFIGYYALGMHLLAVCRWLAMENKGRRCIHFAARDGYILKQAYDMLYSDDPELPKSNYIYLSRKSLAVIDLKSVSDLYSFADKLNVANYSPEKILDLIEPCFRDGGYFQILAGARERYGAELNIHFGSNMHFDLFVKWLSDNYSELFDFDTLRKKSKAYFSGIISKGDVIFDIGYSGRAEKVLSDLLGYPVDSYYIHSNSEMLDARMEKGGFKTSTFYNFKPGVTGIIREHMMMQMGPSVVGYNLDKGQPIFEDYKISYQTRCVTSVMQNAALDFIREIKIVFADEKCKLYARREDMSMPLEYFLNFSKAEDRRVFSSLMFEDDFGEGNSVRALDLWDQCISGRLESLKYIEKDPVINRLAAEKTDVQSAIYVSKHKPFDHESKRICFFTDPLSKNESNEDNFAKCSDDTSNMVIFRAIEENIHPHRIKNWFITHEGGFKSQDYDVYITSILNSIKENQDLTFFRFLLDKLGDKPLVPLSIGLSCDKEKSDFAITPSSLNILSEIAERCKSIGVTGEYTAEILSKNGIHNSVIIGSPSVYSEYCDIQAVNSDIKESIGSFRPFYGNLSRSEKKLIEYFSQNDFRMIGTTPLKLKKENAGGMFCKKYGEYINGREILFTIEEWEKIFEKAHFAMGMNFHNNILAVRSGVPALFINYETLGREVCKYFGLPCMEIEDFDFNRSQTEYCKMADYSEFKARYGACRNNFKNFLNENGIDIDRSNNVNHKTISKQ